MSSMIRAIIFALYATAFLVLSDISRSTACAMASPLRQPLLASHLAPSSSYTNTAIPRASRPPKMQKIKRDSLAVPIELTRSMSPRRIIAQARSAEKAVSHKQTPDPFTDLSAHYQRASENSRNLQNLAAQSASVKEDDHDFQKNCVNQLTAYSNNLLALQTGVASLSDKGLANYDRTNDVETLLKDVVNLNKETLNAAYILVKNLPILGPILGPIVYDIKCLVDAILNAVEDLTDAIINAVQPLLHSLPVIGTPKTKACESGVELLGICF